MNDAVKGKNKPVALQQLLYKRKTILGKYQPG